MIPTQYLQMCWDTFLVLPSEWTAAYLPAILTSSAVRCGALVASCDTCNSQLIDGGS